MSKLLKLKKHLTIEDATRYISKFMEEPVTVADIYDLVLNGKLTLSVLLNNQAFVVGGRCIEKPDNESNQYQVDENLLTGGRLDSPYSICLDDELSIEKDKWLIFDKEILAIDGVWDLAMIGLERHKVQVLYNNEINSEEPKLSVPNDFFLKRGQQVFKVKSHIPLLINDHNKAALQTKMESLLASRGLTLKDVENNSYALDVLSDRELDDFSAISLAFALSHETEVNTTDTQPHDCLTLEDISYQFVIRTSELTRFFQSSEVDSETDHDESPMHPRERNSYLALMGVFAEEAGIDLSRRGISTSIQAMMEIRGLSMSDDTIRKITSQVAEAMERKRM
ncbi:hypothetical protein [Vibrio sp. McD22-P3]|uniref:hypothetical protein n=1 Tax=Vibrio sp. McD22-P3 TaxID=2724880 RepID=UPI001F3C8CD9|nr:hypothetical protein [Vibrio sp. McD22-P3]MCF4174462.1 hypothetical protein [Vibrio sp. McD22-P3]